MIRFVLLSVLSFIESKGSACILRFELTVLWEKLNKMGRLFLLSLGRGSFQDVNASKRRSIIKHVTQVRNYHLEMNMKELIPG